MTAQRVLLWLAAVFFVSAGLLHFLTPEPYLRIMPPYIPWHRAMVESSGAAEIAGGVGLVIPAVRRFAAWWLVALLIAVFPANVYMATNDIAMGSAHLPAWALWGRLPLQAVFIWWVLWSAEAVQRA